MTSRKRMAEYAELWIDKAQANIAKWGDEGLTVLTLCAIEELGEVAKAILKHGYEHGEHQRITEEIDDLAALVFQLKESYRNETE